MMQGGKTQGPAALSPSWSPAAAHIQTFRSVKKRALPNSSQIKICWDTAEHFSCLVKSECVTVRFYFLRKSVTATVHPLNLPPRTYVYFYNLYGDCYGLLWFPKTFRDIDFSPFMLNENETLDVVSYHLQRRRNKGRTNALWKQTRRVAQPTQVYKGRFS